jgi:hypothetical protein
MLLRSPAGDVPAEPPWLATAYREFTRRLLADGGGYPCHFGVQGQRGGGNWFTAVDEHAPGEHDLDGLADVVREFRHRAWTGPRRQSLVVFVGPPDPAAALDRERERFWAVLSGLSQRDTRPWPADQSTDTADPHWQWCFDGEPWFVFAASPAYRRRRSRNLGPCLVAVLQVRRVFDGLSGSSLAGRAAKARIRHELSVYDEVGPHPHLGDQEASSSYKWRQYVLPDDDEEFAPQGCPFPAPQRHPRAAGKKPMARKGMTR